MSKQICILIPTYNRPKCIIHLVRRLRELKPNILIAVVDDGSSQSFSHENINLFYKFKSNNGKKKWCNVVNKLFELGLSTNSQHFIFMPDDALPNADFFSRAFRIWNEIEDSKKIALHLANNGRKRNWTNFERVDYNEDVFLSQTTEFSFLCTREFITVRIPQQSPVRWIKNPLLGSGVGDKLNRHWIGKQKNIYGVKKSLIHANLDSSESEMNKEERKLNKWKLL